MKMGGSHDTILPPLVIPACAGIQVCFGEFAWLPAPAFARACFRIAGMTEPNRYPASCYHSAPVLFEGNTKDTKKRVALCRRRGTIYSRSLYSSGFSRF